MIVPIDRAIIILFVLCITLEVLQTTSGEWLYSVTMLLISPSFIISGCTRIKHVISIKYFLIDDVASIHGKISTIFI